MVCIYLLNLCTPPLPLSLLLSKCIYIYHDGYITLYFVGVQAFRQAQHGAGSGAIFLDLLSCDGAESDISECSMRYLHSCSHSDDASVQCIGELFQLHH